MLKVEPIRTFDRIKLLVDSRRMKIMQLLMASPATLSQLARTLGQSPAWVRHHIKILESADLVEIAEIRTTGTVTEKYYHAQAGAFFLQGLILPRDKRSSVIFSGSHDLAMEAVASALSKHMNLLNLPVGSLDGLVNLRQGLCHLSGTHLLDEEGRYNISYVRRFFPDQPVDVITLAHRVQGLMVRTGNPKSIKTISDLVYTKIRFVNRNAGSGTRLWLDNELKKMEIHPESIRGYGLVVNTHTEAADLIKSGKADAALGLQAAAGLYGLDFIPLFDERYDLILSHDQQETFLPLLEYLQTSAFRTKLNDLTGYNARHTGEQIPM